MVMMRPEDLAYVRQQAEAALPDTADFYHASQSADSRGGVTPSSSHIHFNEVPCRLSQANRMVMERLMGDRPTADADYILTIAHDIAVTEEMTVKILDQDYDIVFVSTDRSWSTARRLALKRRGE